MKTIMSGCLAVVYATMFAACAVDSAPDKTASTDTSTASELTSSIATGKIVHVPPEQAVDHVDGLVMAGNGATIVGDGAMPNACHVNLLFCDDPRFGLPSYDQSGCAFPQSFNAARSLCMQVCGHIDCNTLVCVGTNCP